MPEPTTKQCDACDAEIGVSEEKCPKCGEVFADLDELVTAVEKANRIAEKRKKKNTPPADTPPVIKPSISSRLRGLGKVVKNA